MPVVARPAAAKGAALSKRRRKPASPKTKPRAPETKGRSAVALGEGASRRRLLGKTAGAVAEESPEGPLSEDAAAAASQGEEASGAATPPAQERRQQLGLQPPGPPAARRPLAVRRLADGLVGSVVDVTYTDGNIYRLRVVAYDSSTGKHRVKTDGLSNWNGQDFEDDVDANLMATYGRLTLVGGAKRVPPPRSPAAEDAPDAPDAPDGASASAGGRGGQRARGRGRVAAPTAPRGAAPVAPAAGAPAAQRRPVRQRVCFGEEIVGMVIQVQYDDGSTFRVRVKSYSQQTGWHKVNSRGLSVWEGEEFNDVLDVGKMYSRGQVTFLRQVGPGGRSAPAGGGASGRAAPAPAAKARAGGGGATFGQDLVGAVLDVTYDGGTTYRLKVTKYDKKRAWHEVQSYGKLGLSEGEQFNDTIDVNEMHEQGLIEIVKPSPSHTPSIVGATARRFGTGAASKQRRSRRGRGGRPPAAPKAAPGEPATRPPRAAVGLGAEICGHILDLTYAEPDGARTFRVRVLKFDQVRGWHQVGSRGLSQWDGEDFLDTVDLNKMYADGQVVFVSRFTLPLDEEPDEADPPKSKATVTRAVQIETPRGRGGRFSDHVRQQQPPPQQRVASGGHSRGRAVEQRPQQARAPSSAKADAPLEKHELFGAAVKGRTIDVTYPEGTYRARIVGYSPKTGWHKIDSFGLSTWDGDSFTDTIDLKEMAAAGQVRFANEATRRRAPEAAAPERGGRKRAKAASAAEGRGKRRRPEGETNVDKDADMMESQDEEPADDGLPAAEDGEERGVFDPDSVLSSTRRRALYSQANERHGAAPAGGSGKPFGLELVGRIADTACTADPTQTIRVCVTSYDERCGRHLVEAFGPSGRAGEKGEEYWIDIASLHAEGNFTWVDGREELRRDGHALVNQDINFLPLESKPEQWLKARIVGWWPQDALPAVATAGSPSGLAREAVFVAEVDGGERWQLTLGDALLAAERAARTAGGAHRGEQPRVPGRRALLEVFAGSCRLSLAFRMLNVETESYDILLSSENDFIKDEGFAERFLPESAPWDIVHFAPPRGGVDRREEDARAFASQALEDADAPARGESQKAVNEDARITTRMCELVASLHSGGRGFCIESSEDAALWKHDLMRQVEALPGVEAVSMRLRFEGAGRATSLRLLTNRAEWIGPAAAAVSADVEGLAQDDGGAGASGAGGEASEPEAQAELLARYPQAFCDAYASAVVRGATSAASEALEAAGVSAGAAGEAAEAAAEAAETAAEAAEAVAEAAEAAEEAAEEVAEAAEAAGEAAKAVAQGAEAAREAAEAAGEAAEAAGEAAEAAGEAAEAAGEAAGATGDAA